MGAVASARVVVAEAEVEEVGHLTGAQTTNLKKRVGCCVIFNVDVAANYAQF